MKDAGLAVTLEIGEILGHFEIQADKVGLAFTNDDLMIGSNGAKSPGICCLTSDKFVDYVTKTIEIYCQDFHYDAILIDDDMRFRDHGPIQQGCFCHCCLKRFGALTGRDWTREELSAALLSTEEQKTRTQWSEYHQSILVGISLLDGMPHIHPCGNSAGVFFYIT